MQEGGDMTPKQFYERTQRHLQAIKKTLQDIMANGNGQNGPYGDQENNEEEQERKATRRGNGCNKPVIGNNKTQNNISSGHGKKDSNSKGRAEHQNNKLRTNIKGKKKERDKLKIDIKGKKSKRENIKRNAGPIEDLNQDEIDRLMVDNGEDIQVLKEAASRDEGYQRLKEDVREGRRPKERDMVPYRAAGEQI